MTVPTTLDLAYTGTTIDTSAVYELSLDTIRSAGRTVLSRLRTGRDTIISAERDSSASSNARALAELTQSSLDDKGRKQFLLITRFIDTCWNDTIIAIAGFESELAQTFVRTCRDLYPPSIRLNTSTQNTCRLAENSIVTGPFCFALDPLSITDIGGDTISAVALIVARKPTALAWPPPAGAAPLTLESLAPWVYARIPFEIGQPGLTVRDVRWDGVDPSGWPEGEYLIGVTTTDTQRGTAFAGVYRGLTSNPWMVRYVR